jgi:hypothetical protein
MDAEAQGAQSGRRRGAHERRRRGVTVAVTIRDLRDPLEALILEGQGLVERLRLVPYRHIAGLGDCAERVLSLLLDVDAFLDTLSASVAERGGEFGDADPSAMNDRYATHRWLGSLRSRVPGDPAGEHR